jgi:uncharacterized RDD family membrane protein YckC
MVECRYCGERNDAEEQRCVRCLRRLPLSGPNAALDFRPLATATAPALEALPGGMAARPQETQPPASPLFQQWLFRDTPGSPKVIPIPTLTPLRPQLREGSPVRRARPRNAAPRAPRSGDSQQALEFDGVSFDANFDDRRGASALGMQVDVICCDAPVALPTHRIMAAAADISLVLIAVGLFLAIFFGLGGDMSLSRRSLPFLLGVAFVIATFYRFLWCLAGGDTPGMRFARLRLVDFDGRAPNRDQRLLRQVASLLSVLSAGLGLVWALVDEENLTWHDHISKTFPTPGA